MGEVIDPDLDLKYFLFTYRNALVVSYLSHS